MPWSMAAAQNASVKEGAGAFFPGGNVTVILVDFIMGSGTMPGLKWVCVTGLGVQAVIKKMTKTRKDRRMKASSRYW